MAINQSVKFRYPVGRTFRRLPISGVIGGTSPSGSIVANLFYETHPLPVEQIGIILPTGQIEIQAAQSGDPAIDRELLVGLIMAPEIAISIGQWLIATANAAIANRTPTTPN